jgi:hypothetical protein
MKKSDHFSWTPEAKEALDSLKNMLKSLPILIAPTPEELMLLYTFATTQVVSVLTVYFGAPSMFITLWFGFDYGTNPPLGTLII